MWIFSSGEWTLSRVGPNEGNHVHAGQALADDAAFNQRRLQMLGARQAGFLIDR
jgi:hypothetical protein